MLFLYEPEHLLQFPLTIADLKRKACESLTCAARLGPFDLHSVSVAFDDVLAFRMAGRTPGSFGTAYVIETCLKMKDRIDETMRSLKKEDGVAELIGQMQAIRQKNSRRFRGSGTRGLEMLAPRNRLVILLFDSIEQYRAAWGFFLLSGPTLDEEEYYMGTIHPTMRKIVSLAPLSPQTALQYHRVGLAMLQDAAGEKDYTYHPAFAEGGEFHALAKQGKTLNGALNEAWRELSKRQQPAG